ncbi:protein transport protein Sec16A isoform X1 [Myiozetetes cayanensis]|uniref:protein transport protein Sec16A isoform X1 n=1 Tax=Myiozetetes cayanensis TaxID=478635 RepID=UPI00215FB8DB|nr:protein transport protein Sec16A isoform X1 [Myiozetetes cayanensis]XP_050175886.1 protein transport protein Sec16A isoform X1 [Myiozetetes cayanensis]
MQQPPQPVPAGAAPPPAGIARNMYWRNSPLSKRANAAAAPVQPVTDPFAFGRQTLQGPPLDSPSKGLFSQMAPVHPSPSRAGDNPHGPHTSLPAPVSQPGISPSTFSNVPVPSPSPGYVLNSAVEAHPGADPGLRGPAVPLHYNPGAAVENSFSVHPGAVSASNKPGGRQDVGSDVPSGSGTAMLFTPLPPPPVPQWRPGQGNLQSPVRNFVPYPEPSSQIDSQNISQPSGSVSHPPPHTNVLQGPGHQGIPQNTVQAPLSAGCEKNGRNGSANSHHMNSIQPGSVFRQNTEMANSWVNQPYQEQFYPQPPLQDSSFVPPTAQENNNPKNQSPAISETSNRSVPTDRDSGTLSMFFKGDEAENEEILSSEKNYMVEKTEFDACQPNSASLYHQPVHPQQVATNVLSQAQVGAGSASEMVQKGMDVQYFPKIVSHQEAQAAKHSLFGGDDKAHVGDTAAGSQYENVENLECIQNQEVLPSEPQNISASSPAAGPDPYRYGSFPGQMLPKNAVVSHAEGGPNLEAPDSLPHPVRPDSVSSNYSSMSHRSTSSSARPPEQVGTFIQQESGKPDEESSASFFKQIDSSPLGGDSGELNLSKNYHGNLSQPPTPSPPKPTGVFQTSANSSFEPVRSHGVGIKPAEIDQAKMVVELRESHSNQKNIKKSTAVPAASPGNLEQPPDNLETIFMPQVHPLPLAGSGEAGNVLHSGPAVENIQSVSERRSSTRAQGAVKKCDSPATTLWAHNELPNFGGNVLLAPAAPAVYVPAKQTVEVIQPPEEGLSNQQPCKPGTIAVQHSQDGNITFENLENPPKMGEEEALQSQASSGYASLLSSPPTESLQNQPILIAQPNQSYNLAQPINFSISLSNQLSNSENNQPMKDSGVGDKPAMGPQTSHAGGENMALPVMQVGSLLVNAIPNANLLKHNLLQSPVNSSDPASNQPANLLMKTPLNLAPEGQKNVNVEGFVPEFASKPGSNSSVPPGINLPSGSASALVPPVNSMGQGNNSANHSNCKEEAAGVLDFTVSRTLEKSGTSNSVQVHNQPGGPAQQAAGGAAQVRPEVPDKQHFYQQVTKDVQHQAVSDRALPPQPQMQAAQTQQPTSGQATAPPDSQVSTGTKAMQQGENQGLGNHPQPGGPQEAGSAQPRYDQTSPGKQPGSEQPPGAPAAAAPSATSGQSGTPSVQQDPQRPSLPQTPQDAFGPPQNPYYYYRHPYDAYQPPYPPPYPPADPRTAAHLYYMEDSYGQYDPRYQHYDSTSTADMEPGNYRYPEPERPSSRASHCSDRPSSRQGYPEDYYGKGGWGDYYSGYYSNSYYYGDPRHWEPSAYDPRYRGYDQRYWYSAEHNPYQKREAYPYGSRSDRYEDNWRYDPRFTGSFDDDSEPQRDPYGDDFERRSVHSEHSGHSLRSSRSVHSRQSSFSSRSQQSQLYRSNHDLTANAYETTAQAVSLHTDYPYGGYDASFDGQQPFADYGYPAEGGWAAVEQAPLRPSTPEKFSVPHICARFGPGGFLIKALPNLPSEGQPALVEIHSMETMLQHSPEQEEMRAFPGPLAKDETHKVDVINFAQSKASQCFKNENLIDKESASLLWDFIVLLCRQNGTVVGTDLAELLLRDHKTVWLPGKSPNEANLIDFTNEALEQVEEESGEAQLSFLTDNLLTTVDSFEKETERFRELLLYGRKKDALESAMKHGLWGHALLLASKMDSRTHARVMTRFANSLPINDPLQTVYQLMSGRMPAASTCCGDEKWGDWRPHLAMVLSNLTNNVDLESRTIATMGDTLASKGLLDAAHFCYLMAQVGFGVYTRKTTKLVLIGSNHSLPFLKFATNEAIQRTEAYEYAQSLGSQPGCLPNFQVFKFIYACRLAEMGLAAQAFHYCEVISRTVLKDPHYYSPVLIGQLIQMSSQLRLFDPQIKEKPEQESLIEPPWLITLRHVDGQIKEGAISYNTDRSTPPPYECSTPSSELDRASQCEGGGGRDVGPGAENALLASLLPNVAQQMQSVQLMPSVPQAVLDGSAAMIPPGDQEARSVPFYPVAPQPLGPGPGFAPPGFSNPYGTEPSPLYLGSTVPPGGPPQDIEPRPEEQTNLETGMQRIAPESPPQNSFPEQREEDFYGRMASMGYGQRSRTTSESSAHSVGRERSNSAAKQPSPPPPSAPAGKETKKEPKKEAAPRKTGATWFRWLMGKGKNEAHLPDDKNKSIVWDEQKQRWVNLDEPEEESKPPPPPPTGFPKAPQAAPPGPGGPPGAPVNIFSRRAAGSRARYVDVLNPGGTKSSGAVPAPSDLFAPLAPMPIPANVFVPNSVPGESQPMEGSGAAEHTPAANQTNTDPAAAVEPEYLNPAALPAGSGLPVANPDGSQSGELSRSSSMSSLSREVSQHFNQPASVPPSGAPAAGAVPFYNPSQFAQSPATTGSSRLGRIGQRKYPTLK